MTLVNGFERPNLPVGSGWKSTLTLAFQVLRRIKFVVEDTFSWGDFDPLTSYNGMAVTNYVATRARYLKIGKFFWFSVDIIATVAAPLTNIVTITIPYTIKRPGQQAGGAIVSSAGAGEAGSWLATTDENIVKFFRTAQINYAAGSTEVIANGFLEIQ